MAASVLVLGANGYIGGAVAHALRRQGHTVYGLVRSVEAAKLLKSLEIIPVMGEQQQIEKWKGVATSCSVIVDAIGKNEHSERTLEAIVEAGKARSLAGQVKPLFIFTSGCMSYGNASKGRTLPLTEEVECVPIPGHPHGAARVAFEKLVLGSTSYLHPVVVRPGWVYGNAGGHYLKGFFGQIDGAKKTITLKGRGDKRYSWVHIDDLAEAYVKMVHKGGELLSGHLFNVNAQEYPSYEEIICAGARASGLDLAQVTTLQLPIDPTSPGDLLMDNQVVIDPKKAMELLDWTPRHRGFLQEMDLHYAAWALAQSTSTH